MDNIKPTICRIEGHGAIEIDLEKNQAKLRVFEGERLFEGILIGRSAADAHWITPRICGVCPIVHNLTTIVAAENAFGITPNKQAQDLRRVMLAAQIIESHILHLFFLAMPDYLGINRGTDLAHKEPKLFAAVLELKQVSDEIAETIGGRPIHPVTTKIGGFHKYPKQVDLEQLIDKIRAAKKSAKICLDIVASQKYPKLDGTQHYLASSDSSRSYTPVNATEIIDETSLKFAVSKYRENIKEMIVEGSTAKWGKYKGHGLMVGALARLVINTDKNLEAIGEVHEAMQMIIKTAAAGKIITSKNSFHNNIAQAIEVVHFLNEADLVLTNLLKKYNPKQIDLDIPPRAGKGVGALEAPRGTLYYELHFNDRGLVEFCNIITPTVQNLTSIEENANLLLEANKSKSPKEKQHLLEMLIRAYDPCITCSVH